MNTKRKHLKKRDGGLIALLVIFCLTFVFGIYKIVRVFVDDFRAEQTYTDLRFHLTEQKERVSADADGGADSQLDYRPENREASAAPKKSAGSPKTHGSGDAEEDAEQNTVEGNQLSSVDFDYLQSVNPDIIAWIELPGSQIDYPVLQGEDNDYYLRHMYSGEANTSGSIFADCRNSGLFLERNTAIYGHNIKNGSMFHALVNYKEQKFYDENPKLYLYTPAGDYELRLLSGTVENGAEDFMRFDLVSDMETLTYVEELRARSTFKSEEVFENGDRLVSLCTCTYEADNVRYLVVGKLVPVLNSPTDSK